MLAITLDSTGCCPGGEPAIRREITSRMLLTRNRLPLHGTGPRRTNEPSNVPVGVEAMAEARGIDVVTMQTAIAENYQRLFNRSA